MEAAEIGIEEPFDKKDGFIRPGPQSRALAICRGIFSKPDQPFAPSDLPSKNDRTVLIPTFASRLGKITAGMPDDTPLSALTSTDKFASEAFSGAEVNELSSLVKKLRDGKHDEPRLTLGAFRDADAADVLNVGGLDVWSVAFLEVALSKPPSS